MGTDGGDVGYVISPDAQPSNDLNGYVISPQERRQNFSMLETASASRSDDGGNNAAMMPFRPSSGSDVSSVNFADSIVLVGKQLPSGRAVAPAAALNLFARENIGLFINYVAIGAVHGLFQSLMYPFLNIYLNMDDYLAYSAERWLAVPWLLKVFMALLSDGVPIKGSRRRVYMLIGWGVCLLFSFIVAVLPSETPYLTDGVVTNSAAADAGNKYVALFVFATFGYVLADVACDGMLVEFAQLHQASEQQQMQYHQQQNEGEEDLVTPSLPRFSGPTHVVTTLFAARYFAQFVMTFFVAFMCNSDSYGGTFGWGASINGMVVISVLISAGTMAATWFLLLEDESPGGYHVHILSPREWKLAVQKLFRQRAIVQLMGYMFFSRLCFTYYATSAKAVYEYWAPSGTLTTNVFSSLNAAVYAGAALLIGYGPTMLMLQRLGWRQTVAVSVVVTAALVLVVALFTVYDLVRSAFLTLLVEQIIAGFEALAYFIALLAAIAVAEPGLECTSFSLVVTMGNLAVPFAISLSHSIGERFDVYDSEYESDSSHARAQAMYCFLVAVVVRSLHLLLVPLLPERAEAARAMKLSRLTGTKGIVVMIGAAGCAGFMLFWALLTVCLSSFERTSCLTVAGGESC
ncbi:hypothetical protein PHYBOEH_003981 [Phytophthora boehmeriae]|uniref:Transmembrane protein n=1 Tax=Phytophthora boehmeriae TaxID=109152 RepID=A0A8T1WRS4_9STRA|nr:hypothetical protein PHYBOEH_003981 [Phytophthora boehmeriae]